MTNLSRLVFVAGLALALAACTTTGRITTDSDPSQNFSSYKTFAWAGAKPMIAYGDHDVPIAVQNQVADAIKSDLSSRGYQYVDNASAADFAVSFTIGTRDKVRVNEFPDFIRQNRLDWAWGSSYFPRFPNFPTTTPTRTVVTNYTQGSLSVDIFDVARKSPVWHGKGTKRLSRAELSGKQGNAAQDVRTILAEFPPK